MATIVPFAQRHPAYALFDNRWSRCRDAAEGTDAVKLAGEVYLPRLSKQTDDEYKAYKTRALYVNVTARTLNSLTGLVTSRDPELTYPDTMTEHFKDIDNRGTQFQQLFRWCINDILLTGRLGLLVDFPEVGGRGYVTSYAAENIINWNIDNNTHQLNMVILQENVYEPTNMPIANSDLIFALSSVTRIRALYLDAQGNYRMDLFIQKPQISSSGAASLVLERSIVPNINGRPLNFIPFTFITPFGIDTTVYKPPMLDIVDVNLSHYRTSADLEHGRHFTALPVPVVTGVETDKELRIGSQTAWILPNEKATAKYLEFTGQGLQSLEKAMKEKMEQMAVFSTRLMDTSTRGSESPDSVRIRNSTDAATLIDIARATETGLTRAFTQLRDIEGNEGDLSIVLNKNFLANKMSAADLRELTKTFIEGAIDQQTFLWNLRKGDILPPKGEIDDA